MSPSSPRSARSARLLAALLVPLVALPALAGLVVCASAAGVTTSWGERPCPRKGGAPAVQAPADADVACAFVPDAQPGPVASAPDVPGPERGALPAPAVEVAVSAPRPVILVDGSRGPPSGALRALCTVVLRV